MCTAATYKTNDFYFGRTLDYDMSYYEEITVTPRSFELSFKSGEAIKKHYAIIGVAFVNNNYPLYYDAVNEKGLAMAGLNFVGNAFYREALPQKENVAQFELIPWVLSKCATVKEAREKLKSVNITNTSFSENLPVAELHWIIADKTEAITVESVKEGVMVYDNPVGVLTNNPTFPEQLFNLNNYMHLSPKEPENRFSKEINLKNYSRGMGALGLPGDISSQSRFVRAAFTKLNSVSGETENESVNQFFHILGAVDNVRGSCVSENGKYEITVYTSCCNADKGIYYYTSYENRRITAVDMNKEELEGCELKRYPMILREDFHFQN